MEVSKGSFYNYFYLSELNSLPRLPIEIKVKIYQYFATCNHGCGQGRTLCCHCADKRPIDKVYLYVDGKGTVPTTKRDKHYCPECVKKQKKKRR